MPVSITKQQALEIFLILIYTQYPFLGDGI